TAFRAPTLYQRFSEYGNAALVPEHGRNTELALQYRSGASSFALTAYRNEVDHLIVFGPASTAICPSQWGCYANVGKGRLQGLGLKAGTTQLGVRWTATLDLQAPKDVTAGSADFGHLLARRAREHAGLRADFSLAGWDLGAQLLASGKRFEDAANTKKLGGYSTLDLEAQYGINRDWRLQLKLDNAFDRDYQQALAYVSAPRQFFVGLRYNTQP
ncbi:MAG TPA: TonB-dependent receptor, partial [Burkholderiaceae bacterium]